MPEQSPPVALRRLSKLFFVYLIGEGVGGGRRVQGGGCWPLYGVGHQPQTSVICLRLHHSHIVRERGEEEEEEGEGEGEDAWDSHWRREPEVEIGDQRERERERGGGGRGEVVACTCFYPCGFYRGFLPKRADHWSENRGGFDRLSTLLHSPMVFDDVDFFYLSEVDLGKLAGTWRYDDHRNEVCCLRSSSGRVRVKGTRHLMSCPLASGHKCCRS